MPDIPAAPSPVETLEHRRSFFAFERLILFAVLHVALVLGCLALAFLGGSPVVAFLLGLGGTLLIVILISGVATSAGFPDRREQGQRASMAHASNVHALH